MKISNVLISLYDKSRIEVLLDAFKGNSVNIYATSSTAAHIKSLGYETHTTEEITGISSILNGRVKTLNTNLFAGILAKKDVDDTTGINVLFDMVVSDIYPFEQNYLKSTDKIADEDNLIENIDIGGVTLIRAASKNYKYVACVCEKNDYDEVASELNANHCEISIETSLHLAKKAFYRIVRYDSLISEFFEDIDTSEILPYQINVILKKKNDLRYGENPHQKSALYSIEGIEERMDSLIVLNGKEMSYNNYLDIDSAITIANSFPDPACAIVKHNNPCGVGTSLILSEAYEYAYISDPKSAYGGIVALNRACDSETAEIMKSTFLEVIYAPDFSNEALELLRSKKNLRILKGPMHIKREIDYRYIKGSMLVQQKDNQFDCDDIFQTVTDKKPTDKEMKAMSFGWNVARGVKSNAIVISTANRTLGIGGGQTSRIDAVEIALKKAGGMSAYTGGSALASDGYFPFRDSIDMVYKSGIYAIIQPGGSIKDKEVIEACNEYDIAMVFTNKRHFRH